jgi:hypothetical protein
MVQLTLNDAALESDFLVVRVCYRKSPVSRNYSIPCSAPFEFAFSAYVNWLSSFSILFFDSTGIYWKFGCCCFFGSESGIFSSFFSSYYSVASSETEFIYLYVIRGCVFFGVMRHLIFPICLI